jgi:hypothetical protein
MMKLIDKYYKNNLKRRNKMAFEAKRDKIKKALGEPIDKKTIPGVSLPSREEPDLVPSTYTLERRNKEKLARLAKANGYEKSTAAFLNDLIAGIQE